MTSAGLDQQLASICADIVGRFERTTSSRESALQAGRQIVRTAANAIRAAHRGDYDEADRLIALARTLMNDIRNQREHEPAVYWAGYAQDAMKELAEAAVLLAIVRGDAMPTPADLDIEDAAYLNGLAEAASELRRATLDTLRGEDLQRAERLVAGMDAIYGTLVAIDFPDVVTGGLRRSTDQLRGVLERTRGDLTVTLNQRRLERAVTASRMGSELVVKLPPVT